MITEEEPLEGLSFPAWQRVRTLLFLPANSMPGKAREVVPIDPNELEAALSYAEVIDVSRLNAGSKIVFGAIVFARPGAGLLAVVWIIGFYAVLYGIMLVMLAFKAKNLGKDLAAGV